nr:MAG TPA: hypothetical protein [Caudoviricetes sp.]
MDEGSRRGKDLTKPPERACGIRIRNDYRPRGVLCETCGGGCARSGGGLHGFAATPEKLRAIQPMVLHQAPARVGQSKDLSAKQSVQEVLQCRWGVSHALGGEEGCK